MIAGTARAARTARTARPVAEGAAARAEARLRMILRFNAAFSVVTGSAALVGGGAIARGLGVEAAWLVRLAGGGLLAFAVAVIVIAGSDTDRLVAWSAEVSVADLAWVAGTLVVVAFGWLSARGAVAMALVAVLVADFAVLQLGARRQLITADPTG